MADRRQRQKEASRAAREAARKAAARKEMRRRVTTGLGLGLVVAAALILPGVFSSGDQVAVPEGLAAFRAQPTACGGALPDLPKELRFRAPEDQQIPADATVTATVTTSCGTFTIDLDNADFPESVGNFVFLARQGFYDGTAIHRVARDFVFQGGDPKATGLGGPGYSIADEFPPDGFTYDVGVVAMANAGRGTTGSQFFVVTGDSAAVLAPSFNVLGTVADGMDVVQRINAVPTKLQPAGREQSYPTQSVYVESVTVAVDG